jgi:hypothetical protein
VCHPTEAISEGGSRLIMDRETARVVISTDVEMTTE